MSNQIKTSISRRTFMGAAVSTAFAFNVVPGRVLGKDAPSNKLNLAIIGVGGQGGYSLKNTTSENLVAMAERRQGAFGKRGQEQSQCQIFH